MKKLRRKKRSAEAEQPSRITNETVAEHRERILAGGRRFKYPVQYARHRLVINTIIIISNHFKLQRGEEGDYGMGFKIIH